MKKLIFLFLSVLFCLDAFADDYVIQLGAFDQTVNINTYFNGISNVKMTKNAHEFYVYYIDGFTSRAAAQYKIVQYKKMGFRAQVVDLEAINKCKSACQKVEPNYYDDINTNYDLTNGYTPKELQDYEKVRVVIINNPYSTITLDGKTNRIQCYLNMRGISNCRIMIKNTWSSTKHPVKVWVYSESNNILDIESEFRKILRSKTASSLS